MTSIYALTDEAALPASPLPDTNGYLISCYDLNGHLVQEWVPDFNHYTSAGFYGQQGQWLCESHAGGHSSVTTRTNPDGTVVSTIKLTS